MIYTRFFFILSIVIRNAFWYFYLYNVYKMDSTVPYSPSKRNMNINLKASFDAITQSYKYFVLGYENVFGFFFKAILVSLFLKEQLCWQHVTNWEKNVKKEKSSQEKYFSIMAENVRPAYLAHFEFILYRNLILLYFYDAKKNICNVNSQAD